MKILAAISKRSLFLKLVMVCAIMATALSAIAGSRSSVQRTTFQGETHTGKCCAAFDASVEINEPEKLQPIIVTWSTDYRATGASLVALRLNDGPCTFFGPAYLPAFSPEDGTYSSKTFQWVIMPGDFKLARGVNVIKVCGGGIFSDADTLTLGFNTISAHLQR